MNNLSVQWQYELIKQHHAELQAEAAQQRLIQAINPTTTPWLTRLWRILSLRSERQIVPWLQRPERTDDVLCSGGMPNSGNIL